MVFLSPPAPLCCCGARSSVRWVVRRVRRVCTEVLLVAGDERKNVRLGGISGAQGQVPGACQQPVCSGGLQAPQGQFTTGAAALAYNARCGGEAARWWTPPGTCARFRRVPACQTADGSCSEPVLLPGGADDVGFDLPARAAAAAIRPTVVAPSGRQGNGIDDDAWAPILEVGAGIAVPLLGAFRAAGVPAYAASTQPALSRRAARMGRPCLPDLGGH